VVRAGVDAGIEPEREPSAIGPGWGEVGARERCPRAGRVHHGRFSAVCRERERDSNPQRLAAPDPAITLHVGPARGQGVCRDYPARLPVPPSRPVAAVGAASRPTAMVVPSRGPVWRDPGGADRATGAARSRRKSSQKAPLVANVVAQRAAIPGRTAGLEPATCRSQVDKPQQAAPGGGELALRQTALPFELRPPWCGQASGLGQPVAGCRGRTY
jgi:hypothetical protein